MIKTSLVKWLEKKERETLEAANDKYWSERAKYEENLHTQIGTQKLAAEIQKHFEEVCALWGEWRINHSNVDYVSFNGGYYNFDLLLGEYIKSENATFKVLSEREVKVNDEEMKAAQKAYYDVCSKIRTNYENVIEAVKVMPSAKLAAHYLKELGFDLSELENAEKAMPTALAVKVNTSYLFIKKSA